MLSTAGNGDSGRMAKPQTAFHRLLKKIQPKIEVLTIAGNRRTLFDGLEARVSNAGHVIVSAQGF